MPQLLDSLSGLYQLLDARGATFNKLCRLQGKLELALAQSEAAESEEAGSGWGGEASAPLLSLTAAGVDGGARSMSSLLFSAACTAHVIALPFHVVAWRCMHCIHVRCSMAFSREYIPV